MYLSEFKNKKVFTEGSGTMPVVDSNIKMEISKLGLFEEELVDLNKEVSGIAEFVSPNLNNEINETQMADELFSETENISFDKRIGYYQSLYAGHVLEGDFRKNASSGGMGTWLLKELLEKGLVDYVIHVKKNNDIDSDLLFKYDISSSLEEVKAGTKTKYYPVELSEVLKKVKQQPGRYAIIGIPSFIYSVRLLAKVDKVINERIKYTIGLVCGHQKSTKFAESMAFQVGIKPGDLIDIDFRHKFMDRPANSYGVKMVGKINGEIKTIIKPKKELFGQNWGWGFFKPIASNYTDDVFNETADIVLGDAWLPKYTTDSRGNNVVIVRNQEIDSLIKNAIKSNKLSMESVDNETIFTSQASHYLHTHDELAYRLHLKDNNNEWRPIKRVKASKEISDTRKEIQDLRKIISNQSHIQYAEAVKRNDFEYFVKKMTEFTTEYTNLYKKNHRKDRILNILKKGPTEIIKEVLIRFF